MENIRELTISQQCSSFGGELELLDRMIQALSKGEFKTTMDIADFIRTNQRSIKTRMEVLRKEFGIQQIPITGIYYN
jgi:hypothetical protein